MPKITLPLLFLIVVSFLLLGPPEAPIKEKNGEIPAFTLTEKGRISPQDAQDIIAEDADRVINALKNKDFTVLKEYAHSEKGVRFTPYTYIRPDVDRIFNSAELEQFFHDQTVYFWGLFDGTGHEILLTPDKYYERFIYPVDFKNAEKVGYNEVLGRGNSLENQFEIYHLPIIVEYYFSGFNPDYSGLDWRSLRLVFENYKRSWKLVGIIHNQWTI